MDKTNVAGIEIAYVRRGKGAPLVLIHGYPLDHSIWDQVAPLLEGDFDLIIPDLRGFGQSDVMEADDSVLEYASDIEGLLNHFKIRKAFVAGHSMGGYVALAFARDYPEFVSGLGLVSTQTPADPPDRKAGRYTTANQVLDQGVKVVADAMTSKLSADPKLQAVAGELILKQRPLGVYSALTAMAERPDSTELLQTFNFPVVIVHGDADALIPVDRAREMKAALPKAHYAELPGNGHLPMMENPQAVVDALKYLLK